MYVNRNSKKGKNQKGKGAHMPVSQQSLSNDVIFDFAHEQAMKVRSKRGSYDFDEDSFDITNYKIIGLNNKQTYQGQLNKKDLPNGKGVLVHADGGLYEGQFEDGI